MGIEPWKPELVDGLQVIVDGKNGTLILDPDSFMLKKYEQRSVQYKQQYQQAFLSAKGPAKTKDGRYIEVVANIGSPKAAGEALEFGAEGVGLLLPNSCFWDVNFRQMKKNNIKLHEKF